MVQKKFGQKYNITVMAILLVGACFLAYYFHGVLGSARVFTHLFYIPIILACLWWGKKGLIVPVFLSGILILSHIFVRTSLTSSNDYLRAFMFIVIGFTTTILAEQIAKAEEQIEKSLKEKELLLREIHHRVKNNMQVISSLLRLQSRVLEDPKAAAIFKECRNRVRSMSLIHEKFYRSKDLLNIDFAEYIQELTEGLVRSYGVDVNKIVVKIAVKGVSLGINLAIPCGLLVNELISNSLEHAFQKGASGEAKASLRPVEKGKIELIVSDNGVGLPEELDFRKTESLGLQLVNTLVKDQLDGEIELDRNRGTEFKIKFKEKS